MKYIVFDGVSCVGCGFSFRPVGSAADNRGESHH